MLQTSEYAREYLHLPCGPLSFGADEDAVDQMVAKRMQRQQVLYQHGKQVTVVMLEGALRARVVSAPTLVGQLDRLMAVSGLASLELCIIPFEAAVPVFPLSGFRLYDNLVIVESIVGEPFGGPDRGPSPEPMAPSCPAWVDGMSAIVRVTCGGSRLALLAQMFKSTSCLTRV